MEGPVRNARGLRLENIRLRTESPDFRPAPVCDDVDGLDLSGFEPAAVPEEVPAVVLRNVRDPWTHDCRDQRLKIRSIP